MVLQSSRLPLDRTTITPDLPLHFPALALAAITAHAAHEDRIAPWMATLPVPKRVGIPNHVIHTAILPRSGRIAGQVCRTMGVPATRLIDVAASGATTRKATGVKE